MAISLMTWTPDTCACKIEESHNPSDSEYGVKFSKVLSKCSDHQSLPDSAIYSTIYANSDSEQKRKNGMHGYLLETSDLGLSEEVVDDDGVTSRRFKPGITYEWSFTGTGSNRVLDINMKGASISLSAKNDITSFLTTKFGSDKVTLV